MGSSITRMRLLRCRARAISTCCCSAMVSVITRSLAFKLGAESVDDFLRLHDHLFTLDQPAARQLAAKKDIFRYRQVRRELHLLINQRDACAKVHLLDRNETADRQSGSHRWWRYRHPRGSSSGCSSGAPFSRPSGHESRLARPLNRPLSARKFAKRFSNVAHLQNRCPAHGGSPVGGRYQQSITGM